mgnify:CR=1 FL=1
MKLDKKGNPVKRTGLIAAGAKAGRLELFREMSDFRRAGEIEGLCIDPVTDDLLVLNNRGTQIILGMSQGRSPRRATPVRSTRCTSTRR